MVDLMLMLSNWDNPGYVSGDLNGNGYFNVIDFQILLANWGTICYGAELDPFYREEELDKSVLLKVFPDAIRE
jgi:hypothetical protein